MPQRPLHPEEAGGNQREASWGAALSGIPSETDPLSQQIGGGGSSFPEQWIGSRGNGQEGWLLNSASSGTAAAEPAQVLCRGG